MPDPEHPLRWLLVGMAYVAIALLALPFIRAYERLARRRGSS